MAFKDWMMTKNWIGRHLDKDLLSLHEKRYSPETCLFVSRQVDSLFDERIIAGRNLPPGIYCRNGRYEVGVSRRDGQRRWVGVYKSIPDAIDAYVQAKTEAAARVAKEQSDPEVRRALKSYARYFADKLSLLKAMY